MTVQTVGVVGCGLMGAGIVEVAAQAGLSVVAVKATAGPLRATIAKVDESMARAVARGKLSADDRDAAQARITFADDLMALEACDLVLECTAESLAGKRRVLSDIERCIDRGTILATNTSSLRLSALAEPLERPERFLGLHFFSPVQAMKLVEIAPLRASTGHAAETLESVVSDAKEFLRAIGKTAVQTVDEPGYVVNRLLVPFLCQAIEMLEAGVAGAHEIDAAMKLGCGHPVGPLALSDLIGLDVVFAMAQSLATEHSDRRFRAPSLLRRLVLAGHVGKKVKVGLYDYRGGDPVENAEVRQSLRALSA